MKETIEHNNRFYGEELKTESEQLKEWLVIANKEIERLNNIINEAIEVIEDYEKTNIRDWIPCIIDTVKDILKDSDKE